MYEICNDQTYRVDEASNAFNQGCDARIAGYNRQANPYSSKKEKDLYFMWRCGWHDVEHHWGSAAKRPFQHLPAVR